MSDQLSARELAAVDDLEQQILAEEESIVAPCEPGHFRAFTRLVTNPDNHVAVSFSGGGVPGLIGNCALLGILEELDMPSHIKMSLTRTAEMIPFANARLCLGTWQGVFLWEHRRHSHERRIVISCQGE